MHGVAVADLILIAQKAGEIILPYYKAYPLDLAYKNDNSPITAADRAAHNLISDFLKNKYPSIPVISEESEEDYPYALRCKWEYFFLVDPLDGTKEFIHGYPEFTVNIALIKKTQPILGVIHAPAISATYFAKKGEGAYKLADPEPIVLRSEGAFKQPIKVIVSRSHLCAKTRAFIETLQNEGKDVITVPAGSALKFGLVAEGCADIYPRFSPTMEWDTAAGHILVTEAGRQLSLIGEESALHYNKAQLINPGFIVQ